MNNIWDKLYNAMLDLTNKNYQLDGIILNKIDAKYNIYLLRYKHLGYPLGESNKGFNKWFKNELSKLPNE